MVKNSKQLIAAAASELEELRLYANNTITKITGYSFGLKFTI